MNGGSADQGGTFNAVGGGIRGSSPSGASTSPTSSDGNTLSGDEGGEDGEEDGEGGGEEDGEVPKESSVRKPLNPGTDKYRPPSKVCASSPLDPCAPPFGSRPMLTPNSLPCTEGQGGSILEHDPQLGPARGGARQSVREARAEARADRTQAPARDDGAPHGQASSVMLLRCDCSASNQVTLRGTQVPRHLQLIKSH